VQKYGLTLQTVTTKNNKTTVTFAEVVLECTWWHLNYRLGVCWAMHKPHIKIVLQK